MDIPEGEWKQIQLQSLMLDRQSKGIFEFSDCSASAKALAGFGGIMKCPWLVINQDGVVRYLFGNLVNLGEQFQIPEDPLGFHAPYTLIKERRVGKTSRFVPVISVFNHHLLVPKIRELETRSVRFTVRTRNGNELVWKY